MLDNNQMLFSNSELKKKELSQYKINQLVKQGLLEKLNKKFYLNTHFQGEELDFYYAYAYAPSGVVCLLSAAVYYNLTTYIPNTIDIAIPRKSRISNLPEKPELRIHYYTDDRFNLGINTISDGNNKFRIYGIEKTVIDIVFYRERVGIEETKEILKNYLKLKNCNINKLIRYARSLKCEDVLTRYLEVLV